VDDVNVKIARLETRLTRVEKDLESLPHIEASLSAQTTSQAAMQSTLAAINENLRNLNTTSDTGKGALRAILWIGGVATALIAGAAWLADHLPGWTE
jgi:uncharacterized coiled-coil protein SlyX